MARPGTKHKDQLIVDLDKFALDLLKQAREGTPDTPVSIDQKGGVFEKVTRWAMVKYKIEDKEPDGSGLADLKQRTKGADDLSERSARADRIAAAGHKRNGAALASFKRSLPATDDGGALLARAHAVREVSSTPRDGRGERTGVSGDERADAIEADSDSDL